MCRSMQTSETCTEATFPSEMVWDCLLTVSPSCSTVNQVQGPSFSQSLHFTGFSLVIWSEVVVYANRLSSILPVSVGELKTDRPKLELWVTSSQMFPSSLTEKLLTPFPSHLPFLHFLSLQNSYLFIRLFTVLSLTYSFISHLWASLQGNLWKPLLKPKGLKTSPSALSQQRGLLCVEEAGGAELWLCPVCQGNVY